MYMYCRSSTARHYSAKLAGNTEMFLYGSSSGSTKNVQRSCVLQSNRNHVQRASRGHGCGCGAGVHWTRPRRACDRISPFSPTKTEDSWIRRKKKNHSAARRDSNQGPGLANADKSEISIRIKHRSGHVISSAVQLLSNFGSGRRPGTGISAAASRPAPLIPYSRLQLRLFPRVRSAVYFRVRWSSGVFDHPNVY